MSDPLQPAALPDLARQLSNPRTPREEVDRLVTQLAASLRENLLVASWQAGLLKPLLQVVASGAAAVDTKATALLTVSKILQKISEARTPTAADGATALLLRELTPTAPQTYADRLLQTLCILVLKEDSGRAAADFMKAKGVQRVAKALETHAASTSPSFVTNCAQLLVRPIRSPAGKKAFVNGGGIAAAARILERQVCLGAQKTILIGLHSLGSDYMLQMVAAGIVPGMLSHFSSSGWCREAQEGRWLESGRLLNLATFTAAGREALMGAGAVPALTAMLAPGCTSGAAEKLLSALRLLLAHPRATAEAVAAGTLAAATPWIDSPDLLPSKKAVILAAALAMEDPNYAELLEAGDHIPGVVGHSLVGPVPLGKDLDPCGAMSGMMEAAQNSAARLMTLLVAGHEATVAWEQRNERARESLWLTPPASKQLPAFLKARGHTALLGILARPLESSAFLRQEALFALQVLVAYAEGAMAVADAGAAEVLLAYHKSGVRDSISVLDLLSLMARFPKCRPLLHKAGVIPMMTSMLSGPDDADADGAAQLLGHMTKQSECAAEMLALGIVPRALALCQAMGCQRAFLSNFGNLPMELAINSREARAELAKLGAVQLFRQALGLGALMAGWVRVRVAMALAKTLGDGLVPDLEAAGLAGPLSEAVCLEAMPQGELAFVLDNVLGAYLQGHLQSSGGEGPPDASLAGVFFAALTRPDNSTAALSDILVLSKQPGFRPVIAAQPEWVAHILRCCESWAPEGDWVWHSALCILRNMMVGSDANRREILRHGGIGTLFGVLRSADAKFGTKAKAAGALRSLAWAGDSVCKSIVAEGRHLDLLRLLLSNFEAIRTIEARRGKFLLRLVSLLQVLARTPSVAQLLRRAAPLWLHWHLGLMYSQAVCNECKRAPDRIKMEEV